MLRTLIVFSEPLIAKRVYEKIAPRLPENLKSEALDIALEIQDEYTKIEVFKILARVLPENLILRILEAVSSMEAISEERRALLYSSLAPKLIEIMPEYFYRLWKKIIFSLSMSNRQYLLEEMNNLIPIMKQLGGDEVIKDVIQDLKWVLYTFP
jgi:hypothetical protein